MKKRLLLILIAIMILGTLTIVQAQPDRPGSKDPPLFNRMPGYWIQTYEELDFSRHEFLLDKQKNTKAVEGHYYYLKYFLNSGEKPAGAVAIMRNYENAVKSIGGRIVYEQQDLGQVVLTVTRAGSEYWIHVGMLNANDYWVKMVIRSEMYQNIKITAANIAQNINDTGKASLYGLYFDTDKTEIKPESEPALQEIAQYLQSVTKMSFYVVGHTDNVGTFEYNLQLSKGRAEAVIKILAEKYGIPAGQLTAWGDGPTAPMASNATEEGKALNRRVELVAK